MSLFLSGFVTFKKRSCGSGGQSILTIYGLLALLLTSQNLVHLPGAAIIGTAVVHKLAIDNDFMHQLLGQPFQPCHDAENSHEDRISEACPLALSHNKA